jgi:hypothetical protein
MELGFAFLLFLVTSTVAYWLVNRVRPLSIQTVLEALSTLLEWTGLFVLFLAANLALGLLFILAIRGFTPRFVSVYELESLFLLVLSGVQACVFLLCWNRT